jgi:hypothetical protein
MQIPIDIKVVVEIASSCVYGKVSIPELKSRELCKVGTGADRDSGSLGVGTVEGATAPVFA